MKQNIIYVAPKISTFVKNDIRLLSTKYNVNKNIYNWHSKIHTPYNLLKQFAYILSNIYKTNAIIVSFGGYWSLLPSLLGKIFSTPVFIILNGTDSASIPSINYGSLRKPLVKMACKYSYKFATKLLPVSPSLIKCNNEYLELGKENFQGVSNIFKHSIFKHEVVYNGLDLKFWKKPENIIKNEKQFIAVFNTSQFYLKGGDLIIKLANKFSDCIFLIAGISEIANIELPSNVKLLGILSSEELRIKYSESQYHFQLSIFEGFGISLCEAMLCECIPIVSDVNHLANIIEDSGFILKKHDLKMLISLVEKALNTEDKLVLGLKAKNGIINNYSNENRLKKLITLIEQPL